MKTPSILATLTILVSIATAGLGFVSGVKVKEIKAQRDTAQVERDESQRNERAANSKMSEMRDDLEAKDQRLTDMEIQLKQSTSNLDKQSRRASDLERQLNDMTRSRNDYERQLSLWDSIGLSIDDAKTLREDLKGSQNQIALLEAEGAALSRRITVLDNKLKLYELDDYEVKLPAVVSARVTAVDPKYQFVVINVGRNQELLEQGKLSISRNGLLVAKVRLTSVDDSRSIANVLPGWNIDDVREGDIVMTAFEALAN